MTLACGVNGLAELVDNAQDCSSQAGCTPGRLEVGVEPVPTVARAEIAAVRGVSQPLAGQIPGYRAFFAPASGLVAAASTDDPFEIIVSARLKSGTSVPGYFAIPVAPDSSSSSLATVALRYARTLGGLPFVLRFAVRRGSSVSEYTEVEIDPRDVNQSRLQLIQTLSLPDPQSVHSGPGFSHDEGFAYVGVFEDNAIPFAQVYDRDRASGQLTLRDVFRPPGGFPEGLPAISADDRYMYVNEAIFGVHVYARDTTSGALAPASENRDFLSPGSTGDTVLSADGGSAVVTDTFEPERGLILSYSRNQSTGALSLVQTVNAAGISGDLSMSRDGRWVCVVNRGSFDQKAFLRIYRRDTVSRQLAEPPQRIDLISPVPPDGRIRASGCVFAPARDRFFVVVRGSEVNEDVLETSIQTFDLDVGTGEFRKVTETVPEDPFVSPFRRVTIDRDGKHAFVAFAGPGGLQPGVSMFLVEDSGQWTFEQALFSGVGLPEFQFVEEILPGPDGQQVYVRVGGLNGEPFATAVLVLRIAP